MKKCRYQYLIRDISDEDGNGYAAVIPKFPKIHVMADTVEELHEQVIETLDHAIKSMEKAGMPIPPSDNPSESRGKVLLRIAPELHEQLALLAQANKTSLNKFIEMKLKEAV